MPLPSVLLKDTFKQTEIEEKKVVTLDEKKRKELGRILDLLFGNQPAFDPASTPSVSIMPDPVDPVGGLPYLMVENRSEHSAERALAVNTTLTKVDGGANAALTLSINLANANTWTALQTFSVGVRTNDGLTSEPPYSFAGATNTGIYRTASGNVGFVVNGVNVARAASTGLVTSSGSAAVPGLVFDSDIDTGFYLASVIPAQIGFAVNGVGRAVLMSTGLRLFGPTAPPASKVGGLELVQTGAADGIVLAENAATRLTMMVAGASVSAGVVGYHSRGTLASPSASQAGDVLVAVEGRGYGATGYASGSRGGLSVEVESSAWTDTSHPTALFLSATPALSTTVRRALKVTVGSGSVFVEFWDVTNNRTKIMATFSESLNKVIWGGEGDGFTSPAKHEWDVTALLKMSLDANGLTVENGINVGSATGAPTGEVRASVGFAARVDGSGGGLFAGATSDFQIYRAGPDLGRTPDNLTVDQNLVVGAATGSGELLQVRKDQNAQTKINVVNATAGASASARMQVTADVKLGQLGVFSSTTSAFGAISASDAFVYANTSLVLMADTGGVIKFAAGSNAERGRMDANGNFVWNTAALATTATDGFIYIPTMAGTPTGTPTSYTGRVPIVYDTTNNKLYIYNGGWKSVTLA